MVEKGCVRVMKAYVQNAKRGARKKGNITLLGRAIAAENVLRAAGHIK